MGPGRNGTTEIIVLENLFISYSKNALKEILAFKFHNHSVFKLSPTF